MCWRMGGDSMEESVVSIVCVFDLVRCLQLLDFRGSVVSATDPNRKKPSLSPWRAGHSHKDYWDIVDFL